MQPVFVDGSGGTISIFHGFRRVNRQRCRKSQRANVVYNSCNTVAVPANLAGLGIPCPAKIVRNCRSSSLTYGDTGYLEQFFGREPQRQLLGIAAMASLSLLNLYARI